MIQSNIVLKSDFILSNIYVLLNSITKKKGFQYAIILFLFFLLYPIGLYLGAKASGVWQGIDYSLKSSYTTYIGDCVIGIINALIIYFYLSIPKVFNNIGNKGIISNNEKLKSIVVSQFSDKKDFRIMFIMISIFISIGIHFFWWLSDDLQGWTESEPGRPNLLGFYHMFLYSTQTYILITFLWNLYKISGLLNKIKNKIFNGQLVYNYDRFCLRKCGGLCDFADLFLKSLAPLIVGSIYVLIFIITMVKFHTSNSIETWCIVESILLSSSYLLFLLLIFTGIVIPISKILKWNRKRELEKFVTNQKSESITKPMNLDNYLKQHQMFQIISNYPVSIINSKTMISPITMKLLAYLIFQTIVVLIKLKIIML